MDLTIRIPEELGRRIKEQPDLNDFMVKAAQAALEERGLAQRLAKSAAQADRGEYADPKKLEAFFDKWKTDES